MLRCLGIALELLPKPGHVNIHRARSDEGLFLPDLLEDLLARQDLTPMIDEETEQLSLLGRESDNPGATPKFVAHKVCCDAPHGR